MPSRRLFCFAALAAALLPRAALAQAPGSNVPIGVLSGATGLMSRYHRDLAAAIAKKTYSQDRFIRAFFTDQLARQYFRMRRQAGKEPSWTLDTDVIFNAKDAPEKFVYVSSKPLKVSDSEVIIEATVESFGRRTTRYLLRPTKKGWRIDDIFYDAGSDNGLRSMIEAARKRRRDDLARNRRPQRS